MQLYDDSYVHPSSVLYTERKWIGEFGFRTMFSDYQLTDDATGNEIDTRSPGHIWLSPHLQACYTGKKAGQCDSTCLILRGP